MNIAIDYGGSKGKRNSPPNKSGQSLIRSQKFEGSYNSAHFYTLDRWLKEE